MSTKLKWLISMLIIVAVISLSICCSLKNTTLFICKLSDSTVVAQDEEIVQTGVAQFSTDITKESVFETTEVITEPAAECAEEENTTFITGLTDTGAAETVSVETITEPEQETAVVDFKAETESISESEPETAVVMEQQILSFPISYQDAGVSITITKEWFLGAWCYIAHIQMSDYSRLKTGLGFGKYGTHETPLSFDERNNDLLTINCDYAEGEGKGVIRNGVICNNDGRRPQCAYSQYTGVLRETHELSLSELVDMGYTDTFDFGASDLVVNGVSVYGRKDGGKSAQRTLIGTTGVPGEIYLVVTEGRYLDDVSRGLQYYEAGDLLQSLGCTYGVALDGGGSSAMIWNGQPLNAYTGRALTGFVYITKFQ